MRRKVTVKANLEITCKFTITNADCDDPETVNTMVVRNLQASLNMLGILLHGRTAGDVQVEVDVDDSLSLGTREIN